MKKINKQVLRGIIRESLQSLMTEGAGAGYDVTFEGLKATDIRITGTEVKQNLHSTDKIVKFTASLAPSIVEWKAIGYYEGVTSEGIYYDNDLVEDFDELQKTVNGGSISGWVYYEDVNNSAPTWETEPATEEDVVRFINDWLSDFSFTTMYGGGWSHVNLTDPMVFENIEIQDNYNVTYVYIDSIEISAPEITKTINWYFDNYLDFDKIYGGEEEMEETPEQEPLQENKKQTINLKESQLRSLVKEAINELDWKTYANAARKRKEQGDFDKSYDLEKMANQRFDDDFIGLYKYDMLRDKWKNKKSPKFSGKPFATYRKDGYQTLTGTNKSGSELVNMGDGKYHSSSAGYTTPGKFFRDSETANAYKKAAEEIDNYYNDKYQYDNEKGWHLDESQEKRLSQIIAENIKNILG